jgi:N-acetylglucosamine kinase-like BadF-type ATPase
MNAMSFLLGIDGGGTKSDVALSDGAQVLATHTAAGSNLDVVSTEQARSALSEAVSSVLFSAAVSAASVTAVCAGVAGAASPELAAKIAEILAELLPCASIQVVPDKLIALEAAFSGGPGLVCISGTGSVAYGRNERGECARAGGWGRLLSDEGSGHWIGQHALSQCVRALDMGRSSTLITAIMGHWHIATREQLVQRCNRESLPGFANLFPVVRAAADDGDPLASEILTAAATELARMAQIVLRRLWIGPTSVVEIALTGGVFLNSPHIRQVFANIIRSDRPQVQVHLSQRPAVYGALYLAHQSLSQRAIP